MSFPPPRMRVVAVASNKGGVGKTTVAANLAIYLRALREALPVLVVGLDDQSILDRMFALEPIAPHEPNLKHAWAERSFDRAIRLGEYGVHFVPSPPEVAGLKARAEDPETLTRILARTKWEGLVILDTKSDLESVTTNALFAADRVLLPVADRASLEEAGKAFGILERRHRGRERARVIFTLVDARSRVGSRSGLDLHAVLEREAVERGWPRYRTYLSRSPRAEVLISAGGVPLSILHHARGTLLHGQMRELAEEMIRDLDLDALLGPGAPPGPRPTRRPGTARSGAGDWKWALLRGSRGRQGPPRRRGR